MATATCRHGSIIAMTFAAVFCLSGCGSVTACPAVGYLYDGPAVLKFSEALPSGASVSACFGDGCEPAVVERDDGATWTVPQEQPYQKSELIAGAHTSIRVVITSAGGGVADDSVHTIPITMQHTGVFGQCPGPYSYDPVKIPTPKFNGA